MFCLACTMPCRGSLCSSCRMGLRAAPEVSVGEGLIGVAGFVHEGAARRLVHALKYGAVVAAAEPLAEALARQIPGSVTALVPIPRARLRAFRYGIDPAAVLASAVGRRTGLPVIDALRPRWWWRSHAGRARDERSSLAFGVARVAVPRGAALVDDVLTTGATALAAAEALPGLPTLVAVATCASRVNQGVGPLGGAVAVQPSNGPNDRTRLRARTIDVSGLTRSDTPKQGHVRHRRENV
jgi:predicted amidophosphoribosyltransferase